MEAVSGRHRLETSLRVRRNTFPDPPHKERIIFGSLGLSCDRLSVDKWLDLVFTEARHLCLGRHMRGDFKRTEWLSEEGVKGLLPAGLRPQLCPSELGTRLGGLLGELCRRTRELASEGDLALLLLPGPLQPRLLLRQQTQPRRDLASVSPALVRQILHPTQPHPNHNSHPNHPNHNQSSSNISN